MGKRGNDKKGVMVSLKQYARQNGWHPCIPGGCLVCTLVPKAIRREMRLVRTEECITYSAMSEWLNSEHNIQISTATIGAHFRRPRCLEADNA